MITGKKKSNIKVQVDKFSEKKKKIQNLILKIKYAPKSCI